MHPEGAPHLRAGTGRGSNVQESKVEVGEQRERERGERGGRAVLLTKLYGPVSSLLL